MTPIHVIVTGHESSGSQLVARVCSHVLGLADFSEGKDAIWTGNGTIGVSHRSLPRLLPAEFPDVASELRDRARHGHIKLVICTRDRSLSELSRMKRFHKPPAQVTRESMHAQEMLGELMSEFPDHHCFSYESAAFLGKPYFDDLYRYLGVESEFAPPFRDANSKRLASMLPSPQTQMSLLQRAARRLGFGPTPEALLMQELQTEQASAQRSR